LIDSELIVEPKRLDSSKPVANQRDLAALALEAPDARQLNVTPTAQTAPRTTDAPIADTLEVQPIEIARRGQNNSPAADDLPDFEDINAAELPRREVVAPSLTQRDRSTPQLTDVELQKTVLDRTNSQPVRFAGSQPVASQLATPRSAMEFARQPSTGSESGRIKVVRAQRRLGDGQPLPQSYSLRSTENRLAVAQRYGGSVLTERAVNAAHGWLVTQQKSDGRWSARDSGGGQETETFGHDRNGAGSQADTGITALATLSLLAGGHSHFEGNYKQNVQRALEYLVSQQSKDGNLAGDAKLFARMYCHSMSLLALSEALAMTGDQRLLQSVQRGVDYCVAAQNRNDGGWRYQPGDGGDMSQFGWVLMALQSAKLGGAVVPAKTFQGMRYFLGRCSSGPGNALASYRPGQGASTAMTAEALFCRYLLDEVPASDGLRAASRRISQERPSPDQVNLYYWYYGTLALRNVGGDAWEQWNSRLKATLVSLQQTSGSDAGSWRPNGLWGGYGGRVYSTAMAALNLQAYYRYLPTHEFSTTTLPRVGKATDKVIQLR
jgi:hypothetical protein